jgi:hypothetical protein
MSIMPPSDNTVASTPNPVPASLVLMAIRTLLMLVGMLGLTLPAALNDTSTLANLAGAISTLIGIGMQVYAEFSAPKAAHANAVASARLGRAVKLV